MLKQRLDAIFEDGVLKPMARVNLSEGERVTILICDVGDAEAEDESDYIPFAAEDCDPDITWEEVHKITAKLPGSLADDVIRDREERI